MVDFFPTVVELMGLPLIPACQGVDQPPTVLCLQGKSYAQEFVPVSKSRMIRFKMATRFRGFKMAPVILSCVLHPSTLLLRSRCGV